MESYKINYKFIAIDTNTNEAMIFKSYNSIEEFIKTVCNETLSHNSIRQRIVEEGYFEFEHLLIKKLFWDMSPSGRRSLSVSSNSQ
jgi:hypothetical protein